MRAPKTIVAAVALTAITGLSVAACGSSSSSSPSSSPTASASAAKPVASLSTLSGTSTAVKLSTDFTGALTKFKITPGVTGGAKLTAAGSLVFPITSGNVTYYAPGTQPAGTAFVTGIIHHNDSGITLTLGTTKVALSNFSVNPGTSMLLADVAVNGTTKATQTPVFFLDGSKLQPLDTTSVSGSAVLTGTVVKILPAAASLLDSAYGVPDGTVPNYLDVGVATITIKLPASS